MKKNIFVLALLLLFFPLTAFSEVDIECPLDFVVALSEIPFDGHDSYSMWLPYFAAGPLRARYVFPESESLPKWRFGLGGGIIPFPFQALSASGYAGVLLKEFSNSSCIELSGTLDLGMMVHSVDYYDTSRWVQTNRTYFSPFAIMGLNVIYRFATKVPLYLGAGLSCGTASLYGSLFFVYSTQVLLGIRF